MTLLLSNDEVAQALSMSAVISTLEQAYSDLGEGRALSRRRSDSITPTSGPADAYSLKSMDGVVPALGVGAVRINSDLLTWPVQDGNARRQKVPAAPGNRWVGLVLLFSTANGEPLAIFPDGVLQRMRVGATSGLGVKYLAREDARVFALIGSGWQAGGQIMAACAVRPVELVKVYSPNTERRKAFAYEWRDQLGVAVEPVESAEQAVSEADVVLSATNSIEPVLRPEWVRPGVHLGAVKRPEVHPEVIRRCDRVAIHSSHVKPITQVAAEVSIPDAEGIPGAAPGVLVQWEQYPELAELIVGRAERRRSARESTCFVNNIGLGFQFAAVGALLHERARQVGLGRELPTEWFVQDVHP